GGRVDGPNGIAVDVPASAVPDGTILTVGSVAEAAFPIQLTTAQRTQFDFAAGITLDFGGVTPSQYVNISFPTRADDPDDDLRHWVVGEIASDGTNQLLNIVDTARIIGGRVATSSQPCPGVQSSGTYGVLRTQAPLGIAYGSFGQLGGFSQTMSFSQTFGF